MESKWINFIPNYKPSSKFVKPIFPRYIHSKTHDLFYASPFSNNNQRTNWHLRFPSTTQLRAVSSPFTPVAKCAPLPTSRRSSIALKRRRYTNAGDTTVSEWSRGKRGIEKTNIETLPSTFHFQENGPMYRLNYIFPGPPPLPPRVQTAYSLPLLARTYIRVHTRWNPFEPGEGKVRAGWPIGRNGILRPYCNIFVSHFARQFHPRRMQTGGCASRYSFEKYIIILRNRGGTIICRMLDETKGGKRSGERERVEEEDGNLFSFRFVSSFQLINVFDSWRIFGYFK